MPQEKLQTLIMQTFWGVKECIMGFVQVENRAKIRDYDICPQCLAGRHTIDHMFLQCSLTQSFWRLFQNC